MVGISTRTNRWSCGLILQSHTNGAGSWRVNNSTSDFRRGNHSTAWLRNGNQDSTSLKWRRWRTASQARCRERTEMETNFQDTWGYYWGRMQK
jgi:hypothetical protein